MTQVSSCLEAANKTPINSSKMEQRRRKAARVSVLHWLKCRWCRRRGSFGLAEPLKWTTQAGAGVRAGRTELLCCHLPVSQSGFWRSCTQKPSSRDAFRKPVQHIICILYNAELQWWSFIRFPNLWSKKYVKQTTKTRQTNKNQLLYWTAVVVVMVAWGRL